MFEGEKNTGYIAAICAAHGVEHVVICPGSRSAPLTLAFSRSKKFSCLSIVDERSAAFIALGIAQQTQKTVALICTSGSAVLNFAPAISEAFYQGIPLLILTADRPQEWIDQHDGQAIRQQDIYRNYIGKSYHLRGEIYSKEDVWYTQRAMNEALFLAQKNQTPIHVNISFREPLYENPTFDEQLLQPIEFPSTQLSQWHDAVWQNLATFQRIIIVAGQQKTLNKSFNDILAALSQLPQVVIITESISNVKGDFIQNANECISAGKTDILQPDLIISFGKSIVSKKLKQFLRVSEAAHWHISEDDTVRDVYQRLTRHFTGKAEDFFTQLADRLTTTESEFKKTWQRAAENALSIQNKYAESVDFSDFAAAQFIIKNIPKQANLQLGNSTSVRYGQLFATTLDASVLVNSNRGTSGIDGCTSTAVGAALVNGKMTFLLSGELSFHYDINALWNQYVSPNLRMIILNNSGGNIFRLIDGSSTVEELEPYFETRQQNDFSQLATHYKVGYHSASNMHELKSAWAAFTKESNVAQILEIKTHAITSEKVFKGFYAALKKTTL